MDEIQNHQNLEEFFIKRLKASLGTHSFSVSPEVEFYLVQLLKHFSLSENFFHKSETGNLEQRPLALMMYDAVFDQPAKRILHLKKMGDSALYHAGVFYDGLYNQVVDVGYYIAMGQNAYASLAHQRTSPEKSLTDLFAELSAGFPQLVEIVALCCESETENNQNLLKWIDRYQKTKSPKAKQILEQRGIVIESLLPDKEAQ